MIGIFNKTSVCIRHYISGQYGSLRLIIDVSFKLLNYFQNDLFCLVKSESDGIHVKIVLAMQRLK